MLKKIIFLLFICKAIADISPTSTGKERPFHEDDVESDPEMEKYLREAIENFRGQMKEGIDEIKMPPLDPLDLRNLDIDVKENLATMSLKIKQITVRDLSTFEVHNINADLESFYMKLKLSIPAVRATGMYDLNGKLLKILPLTGNGTFSINLTDAQLSGVGKLEPVGDDLQMTKLDLDLTWNSLKIFLENFLGGGRFSDTVQRMLPNVGKKIFENFKPEILSNLNKLLMKNLNDVLKKPEVREIVKGLLQKSQQKTLFASLN